LQDDEDACSPYPGYGRIGASALRRSGGTYSCGRKPLLRLKANLRTGGGRVPDLYHAAHAGRGEPLAIWAEGHAAIDQAHVGLEGKGLLAGGRVPELQRAVKAGRGKPLAVRAEGHVTRRVGVALKGKGFPAGGQIPDSHCAVHAGRGEPLAVRAEGY